MNRSIRFSPWRASGVSLFGLLVASCSVVVAAEDVQCRTDADCLQRGPDFVGTACATGGPRKGFCVDEVASRQAGECVANADCVDTTGPGSICTVANGIGRCQRLLTDDCASYVGDPFVENALLFGVLADVSPKDPGYARDVGVVAAVKLAIDEFQSDNGIELNGKRRVAAVLCRQSAPRAAAAHLGRIGAKAILGPTREEALQNTVAQVAEARIPLLAGSLVENVAATFAPAAGLIFMTGIERETVVAALTGYLNENTAALVRAPNAPLRVLAIFDEKNAGLSSLVESKLSFNNKTALQNQGDPSCIGCYRALRVTGADDAARLAALVAEVSPDVIVPFVEGWGAVLLPSLERTLGPTARVFYLHPFLREEDVGYRVLVEGNPLLRKRIAVLRPHRDERDEAGFRDRYRRATAPSTDGLGPPPTISAIRAYENTYLALLSAYAAARSAKDGMLTTTDLIAAMGRVTRAAAPVFKAEPLALSTAIQTLNRGESSAPEPVNLDGILSRFSFGANQAAESPIQICCLDSAGLFVGSARVFENGGFTGGDVGRCN